MFKKLLMLLLIGLTGVLCISCKETSPKVQQDIITVTPTNSLLRLAEYNVFNLDECPVNSNIARGSTSPFPAESIYIATQTYTYDYIYFKQDVMNIKFYFYTETIDSGVMPAVFYSPYDVYKNTALKRIGEYYVLDIKNNSTIHIKPTFFTSGTWAKIEITRGSYND